MSEVLLDRAGRRRSPATMPGFHAGRSPRNKGLRYPADPPKVEEIVAVMSAAGERPARPAPARTHRDPLAGRPADPRSALVGRSRPRPAARLAARAPGQGRTAPRSRHGRMGLARTPAMARRTPRAPSRTAVLHHHRSHARTALGQRGRASRSAPDCRPRAGVRQRFAPHQLRHAHAVEMAREGVPLVVIQRQLGHSNLGITSIYLQGIDNAEIIETVHARRAPMVQLSTLLRR